MNIPLDVAWLVGGKVLAVAPSRGARRQIGRNARSGSRLSAADALLEIPAGAPAAVVPGMPVKVEEQPR